MNLIISKVINISNEGFDYKLNYYDQEYYFKTFDLLLLKLINLDLCSKELKDIKTLLTEINGLKTMVTDLFKTYGKELNEISELNIGINNNKNNNKVILED